MARFVANGLRFACRVTGATPRRPSSRILASPRQLRRSWYVAAAHLPRERLAPARATARVEGVWTDWSPGYVPTPEDLDPRIEDWFTA